MQSHKFLKCIKNKTLLILSALSFLFTLNLHAEQPLWNGNLNFEEIEKRLLEEPIKHRQVIDQRKKGLNKHMHHLEKVTLESGLQAILKKAGPSYPEEAAYKAAKLLGLRLVPPTVLRKIDNEKCSLQFFVPSTIPAARQPYFKKRLSPKDIADKNLFYYLFAQFDTHAENQIITRHNSAYYIALIDNTGIGFITKDPPKVNLGVMSEQMLNAVRKLDRKAIEELWAEWSRDENYPVDIIINRTLKLKERILERAHEATIIP